MTLAIAWGSTPEEQGLIYFDATTLYIQNYSGQVTKHPVDTGGVITDHFTRDNAKYTVSAVITGVDVSSNQIQITDLNGNSAFNAYPPPNAVSVNSTDKSLLRRFIPASVGQFLPSTSPDIEMDPAPAFSGVVDQTRDLLISLTNSKRFNETTKQFDSHIELINLYEFTGLFASRVINNLVMTNITFDERPDTGEALYCNMTFEQVTFVTLKKTEIPKTVSGVSKKASSKKTLSKADSTVKDANNPPSGEASPGDAAKDIDPLRQGVANG